MDPINNQMTQYRLELNPALQGNWSPRRLEASLGISLEWKGLRGGMSLSRDFISPEETRTSFFFQAGYRYYLNSHHALQLEVMFGGDATGAQPGSTLYLLTPSYTWFPSSSPHWGFNLFLRTGAEVFSVPQHDPARWVVMGGLGFVFNWELEESTQQRPSRHVRALDPARCREIQQLYHSTNSVTVIYLTEEAAQEAEDCLHSTRRNEP